MLHVLGRRSRCRASARLVIGAGAAVPCSGPVSAAAPAATISVLDDPDSDGTFVHYVAGAGEVNQFFVLGPSAGRLQVQDGFGDVAITPSAPCTTEMTN